jgi:hypothetical protein
MGLCIDIVERHSVIVVTITGRADAGALEPLQDALRVAASAARTVVVDITALTDARSRTGILEVLDREPAMVKVVTRPSPTGSQPPNHLTDVTAEVYASVGAAIDATRAGRTGKTEPSDDDLAAKFGTLTKRYAEMINRCRQLLQDAETSRQDNAR